MNLRCLVLGHRWRFWVRSPSPGLALDRCVRCGKTSPHWSRPA
jgi:hypothetical protein